ncbi:hypothetical protein [uncultured Legionella sp.]|uniref:hypothetical protein n=1 Tax=uncultured Legionella sp. TaxID=210934 RepID=UPI00260B4168|nr:hypothetical protein [uncultured Legionella sp.]
MNKEFKHLLLKIAALPLNDQTWMLRQLTAEQHAQFHQLQGNDLLSQARRFRTLPCPEITPPSSPSLPTLCHDLRQEDPFYIALILEQGQFHWSEQFLRSHEHGEEIQYLMNDKIGMLKSGTKLSVFKHWQNQLSFEDQLVTSHG